MNLSLKRIALKEGYTIGKLSIDGQYFCDTLEDKVRDIQLDGSGKVMHQTAIPAGRYDIILAESPKFKRMLPVLLSVPHFSGILIHSGNTPEHTSGCILVGENREVGKVLNSRHYEDLLVQKMKEVKSRSEKISILIA